MPAAEPFRAACQLGALLASTTATSFSDRSASAITESLITRTPPSPMAPKASSGLKGHPQHAHYVATGRRAKGLRTTPIGTKAS